MIDLLFFISSGGDQCCLFEDAVADSFTPILPPFGDVCFSNENELPGDCTPVIECK